MQKLTLRRAVKFHARRGRRSRAFMASNRPVGRSQPDAGAAMDWEAIPGGGPSQP